MLFPLIYVVIPIYNVEAYLCKCVDSVLGQTYRNIRVVLVDDGSTDRCSTICDNYSKVDQRVEVIHRTNGGLSAARNSGMTYIYNSTHLCSDKYLTFIDGDDYVEPDYIEFMYNIMLETHSDIVQCGFFIEYSIKHRVEKSRDHHTIILNREKAIESLCYNSIYDVSAWGKLYKLDIFKSIRFPEGKIYEDTAISYLLVEQSKKIAVNMASKYIYVQRYNSIANGLDFNKQKYQFVATGDEMADYVSMHHPNLANAAIAKRVFVRLSTLSQMVNCNYSNSEKVETYRAEIRKYKKCVLHDQKVSKRDKIGVTALCIGFPLYRFIWKWYYRYVRRK